MQDKIIIWVAMFIIYFHIGGLATTNILRLTKGNKATILCSKCICDNCGEKIPALLQLPIISYIICKGKCKSCGTKIPVYPLILEVLVIGGMYLITTLLSYSYLAILLSFIYYELTRIVVIMILGKREEAFAKQYFIAVVAMLPYFACSLFVAMLYSVVI